MPEPDFAAPRGARVGEDGAIATALRLGATWARIVHARGCTPAESSARLHCVAGGWGVTLPPLGSGSYAQPMGNAWGMVVRTLGAILIGLGLIRLADRVMWWAPCGGAQTTEATGRSDGIPTVADACLDAMSDTSVDEGFPAWGIAIVLAAVGAIAARKAGAGWAAWVALVLIVAVNPITDPGFFWQGWSTADSMPGLGLIPAVAVVVSGVLLATSLWNRP